jgi:hypothetical protein
MSQIADADADADAVTRAGADLISAVAAESDEQLVAAMEADFAEMTARQGHLSVRLGEFDRRQGYRLEGATSLEAWSAERFGVSTPTARGLAQVGEKAWDMPHLVGALCAGEISLDKVRAVIDVASAHSDEELCEQARRCSVRELVEVAHLRGARSAGRGAADAPAAHQRRSLRFNDRCRTLSAQLPAESYALARACVDAWTETIRPEGEGSQSPDGSAPLDQRRCDGFMAMVESMGPGGSGPAGAPSPYMVVLHAPLDAVVDEAGAPGELGGELERDGLIDAQTVRRIACDATVVVALDDDTGHTMYEGRARRFPTSAQRREVMRRDRHCRFPGCANVTFTNVHHVVAWKPGGRTDLSNLVLLCRHHHAVVHRKGWTMAGDANAELTVVGPGGRVMVSRPSPLWTRVSAGSRAASSG